MNNDVKYHAYFQQGPIPGNNLVPEAGQKVWGSWQNTDSLFKESKLRIKPNWEQRIRNGN